MPMVLVPIAGGRPIPLDKAIVYFGRASDCDVVLSKSRKVSRKHCCIAQIDNYFLVRDLGSMNGLRVNDEPVKSECRLKAGDELWVGDVGFILQALKNVKQGQQRSTAKPVDPKFLSMDIPVAIPDESNDFIVEESIQQKSIPSDEVIQLDDDDILD